MMAEAGRIRIAVEKPPVDNLDERNIRSAAHPPDQSSYQGVFSGEVAQAVSPLTCVTLTRHPSEPTRT